MNSPQIELALKKQRLQIKCAALRNDLAAHAIALSPIFGVGDKVREGARWLRRNPEVIAAVGVALLVARPRMLFRLARRGVVVWQAWGRVNAWIESRRVRQ